MPKVDLTMHTESSEPISLPKNVFLDMPSRDLLLRLFEIQPHKRLRSVRTLETIAFYKGCNFGDFKEKKIKPKDILIEHFGDDYEKAKESEVSFEGFDEIFIDE